MVDTLLSVGLAFPRFVPELERYLSEKPFSASTTSPFTLSTSSSVTSSAFALVHSVTDAEILSLTPVILAVTASVALSIIFSIAFCAVLITSNLTFVIQPLMEDTTSTLAPFAWVKASSIADKIFIGRAMWSRFQPYS